MSEKLVRGRRSIHDRDSKSAQREKSPLAEQVILNNSEDNLNFSESHDQYNTESGSDLEGVEENESYVEEKYKRRNNLNISRSPPMTPQRRKLSPVRDSPIPGYAARKARKPSLEEIENEEEKSYVVHLALFLGILAIGAYLAWPDNVPQIKSCSFDSLQKSYPQQEPRLWRSLKVGIEMILNKRTPKPVIYLFAHHGDELDFQLIKNIALRSSSCFGQQMIPVKIENNDFISAPGREDDYGHVIEKYKAKIKQGNVILIANLNEIPAKAARALHSICDTHSPIAKDVVIFLTLTINENKEGSAVKKAEDTLKELWESELAYNELDALITRVTDQVFVLKS
ncbi:torsin interacting protein [Cochliomyia hominivorax]